MKSNPQAPTHDSQLPFVLRARVVLPLWRPPIEDGAVIVSRDRIAAVGRWRYVRREHSGPVQDLGEVILMPGLINAHCHLDYTNMAGLFPPRKSFCDWIKLITTEKGLWTRSDFSKSWLKGADMLLRTGTTTVGDIEAVPELLPEVWKATPLRVFSFIEMTGIRSRRAPVDILAEAVERIQSLPQGRNTAGLSPHAPYSTTPSLMRLVANAARHHRWLVATHVAESATEFEMFRHGRGEMFDWLLRNRREMSDCGGISPVRHLAAASLLASNVLATHVNYLANGDAELLARKRVSVVHCPRSHDYFRHAPFPWHALAKTGVNICLGTDSLATVRRQPRQSVELDLLAEMRAFAITHPRIAPEQVVCMATTHGARALGLKGKAGELVCGAFADLILIPYAGAISGSYLGVQQHEGPVVGSMIGGQWAIQPR